MCESHPAGQILCNIFTEHQDSVRNYNTAIASEESLIVECAVKQKKSRVAISGNPG